MAVHDRVLDPAQYGIIDVTTRCTKGGCKLDGGRRMPGAGLSRRSPRKAPLGRPAFQPYWGKLAVRCARINPEKGDENGDLKPFVAIQRVQLPPGKGEPASRKRALHGWWQHHS